MATGKETSKQEQAACEAWEREARLAEINRRRRMHRLPPTDDAKYMPPLHTPRSMWRFLM